MQSSRLRLGSSHRNELFPVENVKPLPLPIQGTILLVPFHSCKLGGGIYGKNIDASSAAPQNLLQSELKSRLEFSIFSAYPQERLRSRTPYQKDPQLCGHFGSRARMQKRQHGQWL